MCCKERHDDSGIQTRAVHAGPLSSGRSQSGHDLSRYAIKIELSRPVNNGGIYIPCP